MSENSDTSESVAPETFVTYYGATVLPKEKQSSLIVTDSTGTTVHALLDNFRVKESRLEKAPLL